MTERLYYADSYLTEFDATVVAVDARGRVALDRSAFYPTSGGQPFDTGTLNGLPVTDVEAEAGEVWHELDGALAVGEAVHGVIDWPRRFDHMQQHAADHMLAGALYELTGAVTIGLHLGAEVSSIDIDMPDGETHLSPEQIEQLETLVNRRVQADDPIRCWFPEADELPSLPLRKRPTVTEHVRVVAMGDYEMVACGGTHPSTTGQIGPVKIVSAAPARGKLRLSFLAGMRTWRTLRANYECAHAAAGLLSTGVEELPRRLEAALARLREAEFELNRLRRERLMERVPELLAGAQALPGGIRLICAEVDGGMDALKELAARLIAEPGLIALLASKQGERRELLFARSAGLDTHMGALLKAALAPLGGKGGGRADFAQGSGPVQALEVARAQLCAGEEKLPEARA